MLALFIVKLLRVLKIKHGVQENLITHPRNPQTLYSIFYFQ